MRVCVEIGDVVKVICTEIVEKVSFELGVGRFLQEEQEQG